MGGIGRQVAVRARAFGMFIHYHNRTRLSPELEAEVGAKYVTFEDLLEGSDVISLNLSLNEKTKGIIGKKEFGMMKRGVVVINTARGKLMDEQALVDALADGKVWSAGLDVYEEEPKVNEGLLGNPSVN
jgi:glyoxylate reductase